MATLVFLMTFVSVMLMMCYEFWGGKNRNYFSIVVAVILLLTAVAFAFYGNILSTISFAAFAIIYYNKKEQVK